MDSNIQIETLKSQIENMKLQIDNISMQNNNMFMMNAPIGGQLINLSMQMLNTGIQAFNIGKSIMLNMNMDNYYEQLKKVSEQINTMLNEYNMQQQMMMQQQIQENQNEANDEEPEQVNLKFYNYPREPSIMKFEYGTTVYEALNQYIEKTYGYQNIKISFTYNSRYIDRNEPKTVEKFFKSNITVIQVFEY